MAAAQLDACDGPAGDAWQRAYSCLSCYTGIYTHILTWHAEHATAYKMPTPCCRPYIHGIASELHMGMAVLWLKAQRLWYGLFRPRAGTKTHYRTSVPSAREAWLPSVYDYMLQRWSIRRI
jgi:hypothetical protein